MLLDRKEAELFFKLHCALMQYVVEQINPLDVHDAPVRYINLPPEKRRLVSIALASRLDLIDAFVADNPAKLSRKDLDLISTWRHMVCGQFVALRQLKHHMVFLACDGSPTAYAVMGLSDSLEEVIAAPLPALVETVLLPFRDKITYDGLISRSNVAFGSGARRGFEEDFRDAKASNRLVRSLPVTAQVPQRDNSSKPKRSRAPLLPVPSVGSVLTQIVEMTDGFCREHLTDEYAVLCRKLAEKLAAKRPSPLLRGGVETWACGIIRTIGWINFLDDRSQTPHMKLPEIDRAFGVGESTAQAKAKAIRQWFKIHQFDYRWMLPSRWEDASPIWILQDSNGFMVDVRKEPVDLQRAAFRQGLIPYVPADRAAAALKERISASGARRVFQFKVTLRGTEPAVWRRIQVLDDTLDKLHEHLQTAMGWSNSHLHEFVIQGQKCGDPELLDDLEQFTGLDSRRRCSARSCLPRAHLCPSNIITTSGTGGCMTFSSRAACRHRPV